MYKPTTINENCHPWSRTWTKRVYLLELSECLTECWRENKLHICMWLMSKTNEKFNCLIVSWKVRPERIQIRQLEFNTQRDLNFRWTFDGVLYKLPAIVGISRSKFLKNEHKFPGADRFLELADLIYRFGEVGRISCAKGRSLLMLKFLIHPGRGEFDQQQVSVQRKWRILFVNERPHHASQKRLTVKAPRERPKRPIFSNRSPRQWNLQYSVWNATATEHLVLPGSRLILVSCNLIH